MFVGVKFTLYLILLPLKETSKHLLPTMDNSANYFYFICIVQNGAINGSSPASFSILTTGAVCARQPVPWCRVGIPSGTRLPPQLSTGSGAERTQRLDNDTRATMRKLGKNAAGSESFEACGAAQAHVKRESGRGLFGLETSAPGPHISSGMARV